MQVLVVMFRDCNDHYPVAVIKVRPTETVKQAYHRWMKREVEVMLEDRAEGTNLKQWKEAVEEIREFHEPELTDYYT